MGTTAEKLTYLNTTKTKIKDSINLTGAGITNEPFRQYEVKLKDAYVDIINNGTDTLYNNFPKVSATGESIKLSNTYEAPMQSTLKGNTYQTYLSGINIYNINAIQSMTTGVLVDNDDYISASYNNTSSTEYYQNIMTYKTSSIKPSTNYLVVCEIKSVSGTGYLYPYTKHNNSCIDTQHSSYSFSDLRNGQIIIENVTTKSDITTPTLDLRTLVRYNAGQNGSITFRLSLLTDTTITPTTFVYQKYVGGTPSPNPSYPQDIHNVSGNNIINVYGKNFVGLSNFISITSDSGITLTNDATTGKITLNGTTTKTTFINYGTRIFKPNEIVSISANNSSTTGRVSIRLYNIATGNPTPLIELNNVNTISENIELTDTYDCFQIRIASGTTLTNFDLYPQVELGANATTFELYNSTTYPINLPSGMELSKIRTYEDGFLRNTGKNLCDGDFRQGSRIDTTTTTRIFTTQNYPVKSGQTYVVSNNLDTTTYKYAINLNTMQFPTNNPTYYDSGWITNNSFSFTATQDGYLGIIVAKSNGTDNLTPSNISNVNWQVEKGNQATPYEPYGNSEWYLHKEIGKVVLNGSETDWESTGTNVFATYLNGYIHFKQNEIGLCNYYNFNSVQTSVTNTLQNGEFALQYNDINRNRLFFKNTSISSSNDFKTWLSTHNTIVYYVLANTTYTKITDTTLLSQLEAIYNAKSKNGTTNINQVNNDLPFIITASALEKE